ncbi:hypothetical protein LTR85_011006 [Meristemomyces frigidus]|nr:hypothetical protein LTR85_011006 [Meristemomyces frigidus]
MSNNKLTSFLDLPAELRNIIYMLALPRDAPVHPCTEERQQPAITMASSQIREESLPLYYAFNTFVISPFCFRCGYYEPSAATGGSLYWSTRRGSCKRLRKHACTTDWLEAIGYHNLRHISSIRFAFGFKCEVTLRQDVAKGVLTIAAGSRCGPHHDTDYLLGPRSPLVKSLREIIGRDHEPGLSS